MKKKRNKATKTEAMVHGATHIGTLSTQGENHRKDHQKEK